MASDDALARLKAGLDRDEELATKAHDAGDGELAEDARDAEVAEYGDPGRWFVADRQLGAAGVVAALDVDHGKSESLHTIVCYNEGVPHEAQAEHIARHEPARVLRQVEALRKVIATSSSRATAQPSTIRAPWT